MIGGARNSELALLPEDKLMDLVRRDLKDIMGVDAEPDFVRVYRHRQAIPQYLVGHRSRLDTIEQLLQKHPSLILTGNAYKGVALNDCVANAYHLAQTLQPT
jgi:oxygen-dependent protoporphyrinogen oxidase